MSLGFGDELVLAFSDTSITYDVDDNELWIGTLRCVDVSSIEIEHVELDDEHQAWVSGSLYPGRALSVSFRE